MFLAFLQDQCISGIGGSGENRLVPFALGRWSPIGLKASPISQTDRDSLIHCSSSGRFCIFFDVITDNSLVFLLRLLYETNCQISSFYILINLCSITLDYFPIKQQWIDSTSSDFTSARLIIADSGLTKQWAKWHLQTETILVASQPIRRTNAVTIWLQSYRERFIQNVS